MLWRFLILYTPRPPPPSLHPFVREELLASRHPSFVPSLISHLFSLAFLLLFFISVFSLSTVWPVGWICSPLLCVRALYCNYWGDVFSNCHSYFLFALYIYIYIRHVSLCLVLSCLLLFCFCRFISLWPCINSACHSVNMRLNETLQTDFVKMVQVS